MHVFWRIPNIAVNMAGKGILLLCSHTPLIRLVHSSAKHDSFVEGRGLYSRRDGEFIKERREGGL